MDSIICRFWNPWVDTEVQLYMSTMDPPATGIERDAFAEPEGSRRPSWLEAVDLFSMNFSNPPLKTGKLTTISTSWARNSIDYVKFSILSILNYMPIGFIGWLLVLIWWERGKTHSLLTLATLYLIVYVPIISPLNFSFASLVVQIVSCDMICNASSHIKSSTLRPLEYHFVLSQSLYFSQPPLFAVW